jgi:hypothetical protein
VEKVVDIAFEKIEENFFHRTDVAHGSEPKKEL